MLIAGRQAYLDLVSDGFDPAQPHGALGGPFLAEAVHHPVSVTSPSLTATPISLASTSACHFSSLTTCC